MMYLLALMTLAVLFQPTTDRFITALMYWVAIVGYGTIGDQIDAPWMYLGGAGLDVA